MRIDGFAWVERFGTVDYIKEALARLEGQQQLALHRKHPGVSSTRSTNLEKARNRARYERGYTTSESSRAQSTVYEGGSAGSSTARNHLFGSSASLSPDFSEVTSMEEMLDSESQMLEQALLQPSQVQYSRDASQSRF